MASPLPRLPEQPLGDLPDNPLGAAPRAPVIGKREPLRLPELIRQRRTQGSRSTHAPLPDLRRVTRATQSKPAAAQGQPIPIRRKQTAPQTPVIVTPPARNAPAAPAPRTAVERPQRAGQRRSASQVRQEARDHLRALYGPQIADHPQLGHADIRDRLMKASAADFRGHLAATHDAALAKATERAQDAQRRNPGYKPPDAQAHPGEPEGGMPPEVKAKRAQQYAQMRDTLDALRQKPQGGQP